MDNFNCYLALILGQLKVESEEIRCVAGLLLKQNIQNFFSNLKDSLKYVVLLSVRSVSLQRIRRHVLGRGVHRNQVRLSNLRHVCVTFVL